MKAQVYYAPEDMRYEEIPIPEPTPDEILIRVEVCAVCGTDVKVYYHGHKLIEPPRVIGHEIAGVIEKIGERVEGYNVGDRVIVVTTIGCGRCELCQRAFYNICPEVKAIGYNFNGGYAQYMVVPEGAVRQGNVLKIPDELSFEEAALVEPLSCCINGQHFLNIQPGDSIVIYGAGPIGCMHAELARNHGAYPIIIVDIAEHRLQMAKDFSIDYFINGSKEDVAERVLELTGGWGADVVIVAAPAGSAQEEALKIAKPRGRISFFGGLPKEKPTINFDSNALHYKELAVYGVFASYIYQYQKALNMAAGKRIDMTKFITHKFSLKDLPKAIETVRSGEALKAIVYPWR